MSRLVGVLRPNPVNNTRLFAGRIRTEEVPAMSTPDSGSGRGSVKTLAIRLEPDLHAQLSLIAQLRGSTITDEIRQAIQAHLETTKASPDLAAKADSVLADIERDAAHRRDAIATLFGEQPANEPTSGSRTRGRRGEGATGS